jgi:hypothetical protein
MDRVKAMDKVKKLLALANDRGATESEAKIALEKAKALAANYGIEIKVRTTPAQVNIPYNNPFTRTLKHYSFHVNCYNAKLVRFIFDKLGITRVSYNQYTKEIYFSTTYDFNVDLFKAYYKRLAKVFYDTKKDLEYSGRGYFDWFSNEFNKVQNGNWTNHYSIERVVIQFGMVKDKVIR